MTVSPRAKMSPPKKRRKGGFSSNLVGFSLLLLVEGRHNFYSAHMFSHIMRGKTCVEDSNFPLASAATTTTLIFLFPLSVTSLLSAGSITIMRKKSIRGEGKKRSAVWYFPYIHSPSSLLLLRYQRVGSSLPPPSLLPFRSEKSKGIQCVWSLGIEYFFPLRGGNTRRFRRNHENSISLFSSPCRN